MTLARAGVLGKMHHPHPGTALRIPPQPDDGHSNSVLAVHREILTRHTTDSKTTGKRKNGLLGSMFAEQRSHSFA